MVIDIVLVCASGRGGVETVLTLVSNELNKRGYRVRIIQVFKPSYTEWKKILKEFYTLTDYQYNKDTINKVTSEEFINKYDEFIKKNGKPDVLIATHTPVASFICHQALLKRGLIGKIPIISWLHSQLKMFDESSVIFMEFADAHLAISDGLKRELEEVSTKKPVYLINNPIEPNVDVVKRDEEKLNIIFLGRLEAEKNIYVILLALAYLKGDWQFNVYGDGSEKEHLIKVSKKLGVDKNVIWHGWSDNPWNEIKEASILVLSSRYEGFGMVLVEALLRGLPVITSNTSGASNIVDDGINGWVFKIDDYKKLAEILNDIQCGKLKLPSADICRKSTDKFSVKNVVDNFENSICMEYEKVHKREIECKKSEKILNVLKNILNDIDLEENIKSLNTIDDKELRTLIINNNSLSYTTILNKAAILNYNLENFEYVLPYLQISYEIDNKDYDTLYNLAVILYNMGEYDNALKFLEGIEHKNNNVLELEEIIKCDKVIMKEGNSK